MVRKRKSATIQDFLPGTAPEKNERVHPLALNYAGARDARMELTREEKEAHDTLLGVMMEEGLESYEYGDLKVIVNAKRKVKVSMSSTVEESNGESPE